jgi:cation:H+ antiporter
MLSSLLLIILGALVLYFSSETLVKGASSLATKFNLSQFFIGLTVVAFATSAPEFFVSLLSSIKGRGDISFGNIIGSNIANIGLVLATAYIVLEKNQFLKLNKRDYIFLSLSSIFLFIPTFYGSVSRFLGILLLSTFILFLYSAIKKSKTTPSKEETLAYWKEILFILIGSIGLPLGANILIKGGVLFATIIGLSDVFIGVTIMAVGTSLPELAASLVASMKKNHGISVGNIIGSNIFNVFAVLGLVGVINPYNVHKGFLSLDIPVLFVLTILTCLFVSRKNTKHYFGAIMLAVYIFYIFIVLSRG